MEMWGFLLKRGSQMTEEQRKLLHLWGATHFDTPEQITAQMLRLDRPDHLLAQSLANAAQSGVKTYMVETEPDLSVSASESQPVPAIQVGMSATPEGQWIVPGMNDDGTAAFMQTAPPVEENAAEDDDESDYDYDMTMWDDDGNPLENAQGEVLVPMDPACEEYNEEDFIYLASFAGTYREVRQALQQAKVGRDQKTPSSSKGGVKGKFQKKKPFFTPGQRPNK